ncbi:hypothetical protein AVEN_192739-1 [Araneus ventricosus]|uniref:Uncharacterized protein n=1 Tax=Araneus ventricosus TaxID=182803 RepID=A0A4Y2KNA7_ARAVE|nr:hypothetical protein AVEN_192739-1 [Araneus ventricosus]
MDFLCVPSLTYLSCAEIALAVFYNHDIYKLAFDYHLPSTLRPRFYKQTRITLKRILDVAFDKISTLMIPSKFHMKVKSLILNMIHELWLWKQSLLIFLDVNKLKNIRPFWTKQLTIDRAKTARILIETTNFDATVCFLLACKYCFFDDALNLWGNMTAEQKTAVASIRGVQRYSPLEVWIRDSEFEASQRDVVSFSAFLEARQIPLDEHVICLILSTKSPADQTKVLLTVATNTSLYAFQPDFKLKCLQQLGKKWQEEILKTQPFNVLRCLLSWPFESNFLAVADSVWNHLSPRNFCRVLDTFIFSLESYEWQNFELAEILKKFWDESPESFKDYAKQARVYELLKLVLNCNSLESLDSNILQGAYQEFAANKIFEAFVGLPD